MDVRFYEAGLRQVASGLARLSQPTPDSIVQLAHQLESMATLAGDGGCSTVAKIAQEACDAAQALGGPQAGARTTCIEMIGQLGKQLLDELCARVSAADGSEAANAGAQRVLVVDDSRVASTALVNAFRARQCSVRSAATLDEAFVELVLFAPSILVSDVFMPGVDVGLLARVFRSLSQGRLSLLVLVSGSQGPELAVRIKDVQPDLFVAKTSGAGNVVDKVLALHEPHTSGRRA